MGNLLVVRIITPTAMYTVLTSIPVSRICCFILSIAICYLKNNPEYIVSFYNILVLQFQSILKLILKSAVIKLTPGKL